MGRNRKKERMKSRRRRKKRRTKAEKEAGGGYVDLLLHLGMHSLVASSSTGNLTHNLGIRG